MHTDLKTEADPPGAPLTPEERQALTAEELHTVLTKRVLTGTAVRRLMLGHKKTIRGLSMQMGITQARVRNVRAAGVARAPFIKDWVEAITRPGIQP